MTQELTDAENIPKLLRRMQRDKLAQSKRTWWPRYKGGETMQQIADSAGVTKACVSLAVKREGHVTSRRAMARAKQLKASFHVGRVLHSWTVRAEPYYDKLYKGWRVPCTCICGRDVDVNVLQLEKNLRTNCGCVKAQRKAKA
jgi:hypothetical protein